MASTTTTTTTTTTSEPFNPAHRATYTPAQIQQYYAHIALPAPQRRIAHVSALPTPAAALRFLARLQRHQLCAVPFENLELHYSSHHTITLDPAHLFHKIVERGAGRGGYCMENSALFGAVLRSLGFEVRSLGAKVNEAAQPVAGRKGWRGPRYDGWNHMLNLVTIPNHPHPYILDVGFGSSGPTSPLPLTPDTIHANVGAQEMRLLHSPPPDHTSPTPLWQYQFRHSAAGAWVPAYAFSELEFTPNDFEVMNHFTSTHRSSFFLWTVLCVKMVMEKEGEGEGEREGEEGEGRIVGDITLVDGECKRRIGGESEVLAVCASEAERVEALRVHLGVTLSQAEIQGIRGLTTELL